MENTKKLTGKELINVGIYTAMTLVIFFVVGLLTALPVVYPFLFLIWPIVCGIPMMLYYTKIKKFGMLTILIATRKAGFSRSARRNAGTLALIRPWRHL